MDLVESTIKEETGCDSLLSSIKIGLWQWFDWIPVSCCLLDEKGAIVQASHSMREMIGLHNPDLIGTRLCGYLPDLDQSKYEEQIAVMLTSHQPQRMETKLLLPGEKTMDIVLTQLRVEQESTKKNFILAAITQRTSIVAVEASHKDQYERWERILLLGDMVFSTANEIRHPLNALKMLTDGMLYWHKKGVIQDQAILLRNISTLSHYGERIHQLLNHMNSFLQRSQDGEPAAIAVNTVIGSALQLIGEPLKNRGILVRQTLAAELPKVLANYDLLEEAVLNLLMYYMHALDSVHRVKKEIHIVTSCTQEQIVLEFISSVPYVLPEEAEQLFQPFFLRKQTGEEKLEVGLVVAQFILEACHGTISFQNEKEGVVSRVYLPVFSL